MLVVSLVRALSRWPTMQPCATSPCSAAVPIRSWPRRSAPTSAPPLEPCQIRRFANDCLEVQLQANCRERDVFLIQPLVPPVQEHLVELLLMLDAARGASAARITVVMPHYAYARSDKKDAPRISIGGRLVADLLATAGASRVLAMTLHSPAGARLLRRSRSTTCTRCASWPRTSASATCPNTVVVSPDLGNAKEAAAFARMLGVPVAAGAKQRFTDDVVRISAIIGEVAGRDVIVLDDEIAKGSTVIELLAHLREARRPLDPGRLHARAVQRRRAGPARREAGRGRRSSAPTRCRCAGRSTGRPS